MRKLREGRAFEKRWERRREGTGSLEEQGGAEVTGALQAWPGGQLGPCGS